MSTTSYSTFAHIGWVLRGNPLTAVAAAGVAILCLLAAVGPYLVPYDPIASNVAIALQAPSAAHWAGTDQLGRDVFSRTIVAASCGHFPRTKTAIKFSVMLAHVII